MFMLEGMGWKDVNGVPENLRMVPACPRRRVRMDCNWAQSGAGNTLSPQHTVPVNTNTQCRSTNQRCARKPLGEKQCGEFVHPTVQQTQSARKLRLAS